MTDMLRQKIKHTVNLEVAIWARANAAGRDITRDEQRHLQSLKQERLQLWDTVHVSHGRASALARLARAPGPPERPVARRQELCGVVRLPVW